MDKRALGMFLSTIVIAIAIFVIGPLDVFTHGFYCNELSYSLVESDLKEPISLGKGYEMQFSIQDD